MTLEARVLLFGGSAAAELAPCVADRLGWRLGSCSVRRFPDGEVNVRLEESVRGREVFFLQPTSPPVNDNLMELLAFTDACRRSAASRVTAIAPYFGYARADRRGGRRDPIAASLVASMIEAAGVDYLVSVDLHSPAIEGFFRIPVDSLSALPVLADALKPRMTRETVVVSPDLGRLEAASELGRRLGLSVAAVHKKRLSGTEVQTLAVIGDVRDRSCVILDDMISTGGTIAAATEALAGAGAHADWIVAATHGVFAPGAAAMLGAAGVQAVLVTDTIPPAPDWPAVERVSIAPLLAEALRRIVADESLRDLV
ncbi:MAG: ribose-phosphate diphosphokinase [Longimicrobiales bacterium]